MRVEFTQDLGRSVRKGDRREVPDETGRYLVASGVAVEITEAAGEAGTDRAEGKERGVGS